ncbi:hypothetical protein BRADI_4g16446v3 [Brachypodium distachyon]|uniref:Uncharacterized protein n=1 Tax=Brachypodium distachyon TaxID=15368 RepID=A0A0Q3IPL0_BRADI|nr:hypothetical protein BRADI_4g16446v3 [Brachypodium distachyon]
MNFNLRDFLAKVRLHWMSGRTRHPLQYRGSRIDAIPDGMHSLFGSRLSQFQTEEEIVAIGIASVLWTIWNFRIEACLDDQRISGPLVVVHRVRYLLNLWF